VRLAGGDVRDATARIADHQTRDAAWGLVPQVETLRRALPERARRAPVRAVTIVMLYLARRYRHDRGYVDETVEQVRAATGEADAKRALAELDEMGIFVRVPGHRGGARTTGTRRERGPRLLHQIDLGDTVVSEIASERRADLGDTDVAEVGDTPIRPWGHSAPTSGTFRRDLGDTDVPTPSTSFDILPVTTSAPGAASVGCERERCRVPSCGR